MNEEWRDIAGYEGLYQVSNLGRVRSLDRKVQNRNGLAVKKGKLLKSVGKQYKKVGLWKDNKGTDVLVHRLVAMAFIPNPLNLPEVNHKDENKHNNAALNLEWCDRLYNARHGTAIQRRADKMRGKPIGEQAVNQYTVDGQFVQRHESATKAAASVNGDNSGICKCANGKYKTAYGFVWKWDNG